MLFGMRYAKAVSQFYLSDRINKIYSLLSFIFSTSSFSRNVKTVSSLLAPRLMTPVFQKPLWHHSIFSRNIGAMGNRKIILLAVHASVFMEQPVESPVQSLCWQICRFHHQTPEEISKSTAFDNCCKTMKLWCFFFFRNLSLIPTRPRTADTLPFCQPARFLCIFLNCFYQLEQILDFFF